MRYGLRPLLSVGVALNNNKPKANKAGGTLNGRSVPNASNARTNYVTAEHAGVGAITIERTDVVSMPQIARDGNRLRSADDVEHESEKGMLQHEKGAAPSPWSLTSRGFRRSRSTAGRYRQSIQCPQTVWSLRLAKKATRHTSDCGHRFYHLLWVGLAVSWSLR